MKQRRLAIEAEFIDRRRRIDLGACLDERLSSVRVAIFCRHMQHRRTVERCEGGNERHSMRDERRIRPNAIRIVDQHRRDRGVVEHCAAIQEQPQAIGKPVAPQVHFGKPVN